MFFNVYCKQFFKYLFFSKQVVVIIVIWIISLLVIYMLFLMCLDPLLNKRVKANYQEHTNEDVNIYRDNNNSSINGFIKRDSYSVKFSINSSTATNVTGADSDSDSLEYYSGNVRDRERVRLLAAEDSWRFELSIVYNFTNPHLSCVLTQLMIGKAEQTINDIVDRWNYTSLVDYLFCCTHMLIICYQSCGTAL